MASRNRSVTLTLEDVLDLVRTQAGAGHPHDYVDPETARARYVRRGGKLCVLVEWEGFPQDDPEYGAEWADLTIQIGVEDVEDLPHALRSAARRARSVVRMSLEGSHERQWCRSAERVTLVLRTARETP